MIWTIRTKKFGADGAGVVASSSFLALAVALEEEEEEEEEASAVEVTAAAASAALAAVALAEEVLVANGKCLPTGTCRSQAPVPGLRAVA
jgi:hypothetical protein